MTANELIAKLQAVVAKHGDHPIMLENSDMTIGTIGYVDEELDSMYEGFDEEKLRHFGEHNVIRIEVDVTE